MNRSVSIRANSLYHFSLVLNISNVICMLFGLYVAEVRSAFLSMMRSIDKVNAPLNVSIRRCLPVGKGMPLCISLPFVVEIKVTQKLDISSFMCVKSE
jgi:hypothetical protein